MSAPTPQLIELDAPPACYLSADQARRITCLEAAVTLCAGRGVQWPSILATARWLNDGTTP